MQVNGRHSWQRQADLTTLGDIRDFVGASASTFGASEPEIADMALAVNEAVTNILLHGYGGSGWVRIDIYRETSNVAQLIVQITDNGPLFNPTTQPAPDLSRPLDECGNGGMGIHLMRQLTDGMVYRALPAGGNELIMKKTLIQASK